MVLVITEELALEQAIEDLRGRLRAGDDLNVAFSKVAQGYRVNREELKSLWDADLNSISDTYVDSYRASEAADVEVDDEDDSYFDDYDPYEYDSWGEF